MNDLFINFIERLGSIDNTALFAASILPYGIFLFYLYKIKSMNKKIYGKGIYKKPNVNLVHSNGNKHVLRFDLTEGKNREIRNICTLFNLKVEKLKRISYGRFLLKSITYGNYKEMQVDESYKR